MTHAKAQALAMLAHGRWDGPASAVSTMGFLEADTG